MPKNSQSVFYKDVLLRNWDFLTCFDALVDLGSARQCKLKTIMLSMTTYSACAWEKTSRGEILTSSSIYSSECSGFS